MSTSSPGPKTPTKEHSKPSETKTAPQQRTPSANERTPNNAKKDGSPRTPQAQFKSPPPSPLTPLASKYAAGVIPITYCEDEVTKERVWKILLLIEWRSKEARRCVHPLAGKKEKIDGDNPIKTAVREFHEETLGVFEEFVALEEQILANTTHHNLYGYFGESKMFLFLSYIPFSATIQERFVAAKAALGDQVSREEESQCELFWYPLEDFMRLQGNMTYRHQEADVAPSECAARWFNRGFFLGAMRRFQLLTLDRLSLAASPLAPALTTAPIEISIDMLTSALEKTSIGAGTPSKSDKETSTLEAAATPIVVVAPAEALSQSSSAPAETVEKE